MLSRTVRTGLLVILLTIGARHEAIAAVDQPCGKLEKLIKAGELPISESLPKL